MADLNIGIVLTFKGVNMAFVLFCVLHFVLHVCFIEMSCMSYLRASKS